MDKNCKIHPIIELIDSVQVSNLIKVMENYRGVFSMKLTMLNTIMEVSNDKDIWIDPTSNTLRPTGNNTIEQSHVPEVKKAVVGDIHFAIAHLSALVWRRFLSSSNQATIKTLSVQQA